MGVFGAVAHMGNIMFMTFCGDNLVNHYMCDIIPLLELSCNSSYVNLLVVFIVVTIGIGVPTVTIFISYGFILSSIFTFIFEVSFSCILTSLSYFKKKCAQALFSLSCSILLHSSCIRELSAWLH